MSAPRLVFAVVLAALIAIPGVCGAQTFRGGISGRIVDATGAVLPGVTVTATNNATAQSRTTTTSGTGNFSLPDLALGTYTLEATLQGFQTLKVTVEVTVSRVSSIDLKMGLSTVAETVQVSAAILTLDTKSTALSNVIQPKQVQDLPLNGRDFTRMLQLSPGVAGTSVNGVRTRGNNYQIDGADNNDAFQNIAAVNQGGVSGIAGTLLPIEAIDQFSVHQSRDQVGHERRSRHDVLLQPQRGAVGELARRRTRHAEARDSEQPVRLLARRPDRPQQDVLLLDVRGAEAGRGQLAHRHGTVGRLGGGRDEPAAAVQRSRESGVDEPAVALARRQPDGPGHGAELRQRRSEHVLEL
ncbi:MAG: hypothetical protein DMG03_00420 [Acidobacteria bacterium]|nr:MAG: hypothetical protein DMG03_00420 [Acidobacteriota bacterium]